MPRFVTFESLAPCEEVGWATSYGGQLPTPPPSPTLEGLSWTDNTTVDDVSMTDRFTVDEEEQYRAKPAIRLFIPDILKSVLVDDWEQITSKGNFVVLPSKTPIEMILDDYNQHRKEQSDYVYSDLFEESLKGLKAYADIAIPRRLLYRQERRIENGVESQYLHIAKRMKTEGDELFGKRIHQVFGCEHFLRQLTHMPQLVAQTNMDDQSITRIRNEITALLLWLARDEQIKKYLSAAYRPWACELQH